MMEQIKRFITCYVPVHACNFRCSYCYLSHHKDVDAYGGGIKKFAVAPETIAKFFSVDRTGGLCYFNLCAAGETMMHPELIDLVSLLAAEGHYVDIVTNGTLSKKFDELISKLNSEQRKKVFIKFSFHYFQLKEKKMMDTFLRNIKAVKAAGISYTIEITPHDELIPYIDEIKDFSIREFGALPHITVARNEEDSSISLLTKLNRDEYKKTWGTFNSALFNFKIDIFNQKRTEFCYAGLWSLAVNLETGYYQQCYIGDRLGSIDELDKPINFRAIGKCREPHCFNGHAFLGFGDIPEINKVTYAEERDRLTTTNEHWLQPEAAAFFATKLNSANKEFDDTEKNKVIRNIRIHKLMDKAVHVRDKIKRSMK